jgi:hypothetical protein
MHGWASARPVQTCSHVCYRCCSPSRDGSLGPVYFRTVIRTQFPFCVSRFGINHEATLGSGRSAGVTNPDLRMNAIEHMSLLLHLPNFPSVSISFLTRLESSARLFFQVSNVAGVSGQAPIPCLDCAIDFLGARLSHRCFYVRISLLYDSRISASSVLDTVHSAGPASTLPRSDPLAPISFPVNEVGIFGGLHELSKTKRSTTTPFDHGSLLTFLDHYYLPVAQIQCYRALLPSLPVAVPPRFAFI